MKFSGIKRLSHENYTHTHQPCIDGARCLCVIENMFEYNLKRCTGRFINARHEPRRLGSIHVSQTAPRLNISVGVTNVSKVNFHFIIPLILINYQVFRLLCLFTRPSASSLNGDNLALGTTLSTSWTVVAVILIFFGKKEQNEFRLISTTS
jgi:hypothetical protein